jgi:phenylpropionate dioxygenase-like ring-hydroxylating dioxygenase large terminal subunit
MATARDDTKLAGPAANDPSIGTGYQEYLKRERRAAPGFFRSMPADAGFGSHLTIPASRYTSREFHEREKAKLWPRVWQMACREEHIPNPGDFTLYEIMDKSFLIVRQADHSIRAFYNACLHRGRMLKTEAGHDERLRCPFHGFTWNLDGTIREIPCRWDFPQLRESECSLPQAHVGRWGGWVFINMARDPAPFEEHIAPLPEHFAKWGLDHSYVGVHVARVVRANWKATMEAFSEAWHSHDTHPQILPYTGDTNSQYDRWPEHRHVDRMITPFGVPSPYLEGKVSEQEIFDEMMNMPGGRRGPAMRMKVPTGLTARAMLGELMRAMVTSTYWRDMRQATDGELLDAILYNVFPNFVPWGGYGPNINYRFRPNGDDHDSSIFEIMLLMRHPRGRPKPKPAPVHWLAPDEPFSNALELGALGPIFDQDMGNLPYVQKGLKASGNGTVVLSKYQESRIRNLHRLIDEYLAAD